MKFLQLFEAEVGEGGQVPRGWQIAWREPRRRVAVYSPPPLHWALRWGRELCHRLRTAVCAPQIEAVETREIERAFRERQQLVDEYSRGYLTGWRECFETCVRAINDELDSTGGLWELSDLLDDLPAEKQRN